MSSKHYFADDSVIIYHGDCEEIAPQLDRFDLLLTDPPYGISVTRRDYGGQMAGAGAVHWDDMAVNQALIDSLISQCQNAVVWGGNYYTFPPCRGYLSWDKKNAPPTYSDFELAWTTFDKPAKVFRMTSSVMDGGKQHPSQKPEALFRWCVGHAVEWAAKQGREVNSIFDPFAGSGTTGRVAKDLGKRAILIELEERMCEIAAERLAQQVLNFS